MTFKMRKPNPKGVDTAFHQEKTDEERLAEIKATRDNLNKVEGSAYNPESEDEKTYDFGDVKDIEKRVVGGAGLPGGPADFAQRLHKLVSLDYDKDPVNKTD